MRKNETVNSGLSLNLIDESISKSSKTSNAILNFLSRFLIVFALSAGSIFTFSSMMKIKFTSWIIFTLVLVASLIFTCCYKFFKKHALVLLLSGIIAIIAGLFMLSPVVTGFKLLFDSTIQSIYEAMHWTAPDAIVTWEENHIFNTTYCMALISFFISSLVGFFVVGKTHFIGAFLVTFPLFELGAAFGCVTEKFPFAALCAGWAAMLALHISNRQKTEVKHRNGEQKKSSKRFVYNNKSSRFGGSAIVMATAVFLCFVIITSTLTSAGFARSETLDELRKNVKETTLDIYDRITGFDHDASLKEGNLKVLGDRKVRGREYVTIQLPNIKQSLYLRGYVGCKYTGKEWVDFDKSTYDKLGAVKSALSERSYYLATLMGDVLYGDFGNSNLKLANFKLYNFRREKEYVYAPNGIIADASITPFEDLYAKPNYPDEYSYIAYYDFADYLTLPYTSTYNTDDFQDAWAVYSEFVQNNYVLLPEGIDDVANLAAQLKGDTVYHTVDKIREFLTNNTEYSSFVQKLPDEKEFSSFFLFDKGVGYSAHYATSATVMLRALGIPARYVEGFYVAQQDIENASGDDRQKTITLTDGASHAWVEIFDSKFGWIPVEFTNGYYSGSFVKQMQQAINKNEHRFENQEQEKEEEVKPNNEIIETEPQQEFEEEEEEEKEEEKKKASPLLVISIIIGSLLLIVIGLIVFLIIRRSKIIAKRKEFFDSKELFKIADYRVQVIFCFELLRKMLEFQRIQFKELYTFEEFKQVLEDNFMTDEETEVSFEEIFEIYERAMFSKLLITEEDASKVIDFIDEFGFGMYESLTLLYRLKWKFIDVIS